MIFLILSCVEVFLQMYLGIGLYLRNCEQRRGRKKWQKAILYLILLGIFCIEVYDKQGLLVSWGSILLDIILEGVWLWYYAGERHIKIFAWIFFVRWTIGLLDMVVVIVSSFRGGYLKELVQI